MIQLPKWPEELWRIVVQPDCLIYSIQPGPYCRASSWSLRLGSYAARQVGRLMLLPTSGGAWRAVLACALSLETAGGAAIVQGHTCASGIRSVPHPHIAHWPELAIGVQLLHALRAGLTRCDRHNFYPSQRSSGKDVCRRLCKHWILHASTSTGARTSTTWAWLHVKS